MLTALDLFSGCGGFSLGAKWAALKSVLAVDIDPILSSSYQANFPDAQLLRGNIERLTPQRLARVLPNGVDVVFGGPPCQAFSEIGGNAPDDSRRKLVAEFFRVVAAVDPAAFIFENVRGLQFEKHIGVLNEALKLLPSHWTTLGPVLLCASEFGAPTRRKRLFIFGINRRKAAVPDLEALTKGTGVSVSVRDAIADIQTAKPVSAARGEFDVWEYDSDATVSDYARSTISPDGRFTGHTRTSHTAMTVERFSKVKPGGVDAIGRYPRLEWTGHCPTLRAGTGADHGSYQAVRPIHPEENRVITPREAARIQGFPDAFKFHPTVWHSCRMIGNSMSPLMAKVLISRLVEGAGLCDAPASMAAE